MLKTLDGDEARWKEVQLECNTLLENIKSLRDELNDLIIGRQMIGFRPCAGDTEVEYICGYLDDRTIDSKVIDSYQIENDLIELCKLSRKEFELLYRASRDGFEASSFHEKCDNNSNTLTIIKTTSGCIFGGYAEVAWDSSNKYKADPNSFIFSLVNENSTPRLIPVQPNHEYAIYCSSVDGPIFGGGHDIKILSDSNKSKESYSNLGRSFDFKFFTYGSLSAQSFLAGSRNFQVFEIEVFQLI